MSDDMIAAEPVPSFDLSGRVAVVTGAARGLGRASALALASAGATVALGLRDANSDRGLLELIERQGGNAMAVQMDVTDLRQCYRAVDHIRAELGSIDILVNNAGGGIDAPAIEVTEKDFNAVMDLNMRSTFFLSQYVGRIMIDHGYGRIVNMASQGGLVALPGEISYCVAKAAVVHMTHCMAVEWGQYGVTVNAVAPTFIETDGTHAALSDPDFRNDVVNRIAALHRIGKPHEVAAAVVFLSSPAATLITGQVLAVDGGWTVR
jgi:NAD(P)-dependent dehydrogenase (short-subunit alcohol dehydrogenase family)